jgi:acylphosphatase
VRRRVFISGDVQGVFFRAECQRQASATGVNGWVRNLPDGGLEAVFEGPAEAVERLVAWCRIGPPRARVADVQVHAEEAVGETRFSVR